jgi:hypothetical protein
MIRECLKHIISGGFTQLKTLQLYLAVRESGGAKDAIWDKLKNYCTSSLQKYNVYIRTGFNNEALFKLDLTDNKDEKYDELYPIDYYDYFWKQVYDTESELDPENFDSIIQDYSDEDHYHYYY